MQRSLASELPCLSNKEIDLMPGRGCFAKFALAILSCLSVHWATPAVAQCSRNHNSAGKAGEPVIIDSDIGDDIDDAFALALALRSPEFRVLGVSVDFGNTPMRARLADRFLKATGCSNIPVAMGEETTQPIRMTQMNYALAEKESVHPDATDFILKAIRENPGQVTLIAIGPLVNVGSLIDKDPETFRKLKRVVMMGGSIERRSGDLSYLPATGPMPEYNIRRDIPDAQKLFASGVPIYMMPLDSTQIKLDEVKREILFKMGTSFTDQLTLLYHQWGQITPTLYDAMAVAYAIKPELCPVEPMHIVVDQKGYTRRETGPPNAHVCLHSNSDDFFSFFMPRFSVVGER